MPKELLSAIAVGLTFWLFIPYIRGIRRGTTRPHVFSWIVWTLVTVAAGAAQLAGGGGVGAWPIVLSGLITAYVGWLAWRRVGQVAITRLDWAFLLAAFTALPAWAFTADPLWASVILTVVDLLGFGPTVRKAWHHPHEESALFFGVGALRNACVVLALEHYSLTTVLFPAAVGAGCLAVAALVLARRRIRSARGERER